MCDHYHFCFGFLQLYVMVAVGGGLWEFQDLSNRLHAVALVIEEPPRPELRILSIRTTKLDSGIVQRQAASGQLLEVTWKGINIGMNLICCLAYIGYRSISNSITWAVICRIFTVHTCINSNYTMAVSAIPSFTC